MFRHIARYITIGLFSFNIACQGTYFTMQSHTDADTQSTPDISGSPSNQSQDIYESQDLTMLCDFEECEPNLLSRRPCSPAVSRSLNRTPRPATPHKYC